MPDAAGRESRAESSAKSSVELSVRTADGVLLAGEETGGQTRAETDPGGQAETGTGPGGQAGAEIDPGGQAGTGTGSGGQAGAGEGMPIVLLHGLTATRRYVVMGSRLLERSGHRVIAYDARGHGRSTFAPDPAVDGARGHDRSPSAPDPGASEAAYGYGRLAQDLLAVLDALGLERAVLAGASMGAHTIVRFALRHPERVAALGLITPGYDPAAHPTGDEGFTAWDALARGLREGGVEGFVAAYDFAPVPDRWRGTVEKVVRQRLSAHEHPEAVADALEAVPRSRPFEDMTQLGAIKAPAVVVASRDEADPGHPLALAERYARAIPGAELIVEEPGASPIAWQGGRVSNVLRELVADA